MNSLYPVESKPTFHGCTTTLPNEITKITKNIIQYVIAEAQPPPLGGGASTRDSPHPLASVSWTLRSIYLNHPYHAPNKTKQRSRSPFRIGEVCEHGSRRELTERNYSLGAPLAWRTLVVGVGQVPSVMEAIHNSGRNTTNVLMLDTSIYITEKRLLRGISGSALPIKTGEGNTQCY
jgi:hypothetical protein